MTYVARFEFIAVIRLGTFPSRVDAELEASKRFGGAVLRVQSQADYREAMEETQALKRARRREV